MQVCIPATIYHASKTGRQFCTRCLSETVLVTSLAARTPEEGEGGSNVGDIVEVNDGHVQRAVNSDFACIMFKQ